MESLTQSCACCSLPGCGKHQLWVYVVSVMCRCAGFNAGVLVHGVVLPSLIVVLLLHVAVQLCAFHRLPCAALITNGNVASATTTLCVGYNVIQVWGVCTAVWLLAPLCTAGQAPCTMGSCVFGVGVWDLCLHLPCCVGLAWPVLCAGKLLPSTTAAV